MLLFVGYISCMARRADMVNVVRRSVGKLIQEEEVSPSVPVILQQFRLLFRYRVPPLMSFVAVIRSSRTFPDAMARYLKIDVPAD
jgi:hypothetical protein